ncbi:MAG: choice-of-anchor L domain-containing protein [Kofleriaceae bacterium]
MSTHASLVLIMLVACGPAGRLSDDDDGPCRPGATAACYSGQDGTEGVGPCHAGNKICNADQTWSACNNEVAPSAEDCSDAVDNNCNGMTDEDVDLDGDGFTTCAGNDCCDSTECGGPEFVNEGAYDAPGNSVDDDCNGVIDDTVTVCDQALASNTQTASDFAKAIDLCQAATMADRRWGVIDAKISFSDGDGTPDPRGHAVRPTFGPNVPALAGTKLAILSTGAAAAEGDRDPDYHSWVDGYAHRIPNTSDFPRDFMELNNDRLPNAPGCPNVDSDEYANDVQMLTLRVRVPTNAKSFKFSTNFYSSEFPEYTCSEYNDFFVALLDSTYAGTPGNPADKNLAFYEQPTTMMKYPLGINLGHGNTGLFTQCRNGKTGCAGKAGTITTCTGTDMLVGTGFDDSASGQCESGSIEGGATGWLTTSGNVTPGEIITLRIAIWDTSDHQRDSLALLDAWEWSTELATPGTVIQ